MLKAFRRLFGDPVVRQIEYVRRDVSRLDVDEWRKNGDLVSTAHRILATSEVQQMLDTVRNTHISTFDMSPDASWEQRALRQASGEGFNLALRMFTSLGTPLVSQEMPEPTFEPQE